MSAIEEKSFAYYVNKKVLKEITSADITLPGTEEYYAHPTFCINNLSDYIRLVTSISSVNKDEPYSNTVIFRGVPDSEYDLLPSLARLKEVYPDIENELINAFLTRRPDAFNGLTAFDILAKMQHYGLPTRLLDFTVNPLVALYFSCESKLTRNGRIICHNTYLQSDSSPYVNLICEAAVRKPLDENYTIDEYICNEKFKAYKYLYQAFLYEETFVVRPKYWNQRIANQAGVFMVFSNNLLDKYRNILINRNKYEFEEALKECIPTCTEKDTAKMIFDNEPVPVDISYLSNNDFEMKVNAYKKSSIPLEVYTKLFENRFTVSCQLKELSSDLICDEFCSIIVEAKSKKKILKELSYVGISADYIYPELEYTAKEIKRRYE